ncbi:serine protease [Rhodopirellula sp. MGV]|uniref:S1 family peptidase n=1 Tax=Rhodopirellula sp. MGV TaxID=2023130 RepID=UPI000B95F008|nr:serine protease [Rhodopirellula sp. MGV]OYP35831.1 hypothetical protein CGZ80_10565 [Rhodopirellula sp. MGV]PNY36356.1 serine protease [Rhodopirellula baltica]
MTAVRCVVTLLFAQSLCFGVCSGDEESGDEIERWDRVVAIQSPDSEKQKSGKLCSAFLIENKGDLYLITAAHASEETNQNSRVLYRDSKGKSQWVSLMLLVPSDANPWTLHKTSDLAIAKLAASEKGQPYLLQLSELAMPRDVLDGRLPRRTTQIESVGYPVGLGAAPPMSALVIVGNIASKELTSKNRWGKEPVIFSTPTVAQGCSGGPAFVVDAETESFQIIGMYIGVVADESGAKLSKMVPARVIAEMLDREACDTREPSDESRPD